jgi:DNA-binding MarR family transcriptional regulator
MKIENYLNLSPLFTINYAYEKTIPRINKQLKKHHLNFLQALVLISLFFDEQSEINPSLLSDVFKTSRGNMSHIISDLEYKGFLKRVLNLKDARSYKIEIKAEGKKKALVLIKIFDQIQNDFETELSPSECKKTISSLNRLIDVFEKKCISNNT